VTIIFNTHQVFPAGSSLTPADADKNYSGVTARLELDYKPSENVLYYVSYNRGGKSGLRRRSELSEPRSDDVTLRAWHAHRRLAFLRLRFNAVLAHFDLFAIVMTQRSEHETGVWLSGLDIVARDALVLPGEPYPVPPVVCHLIRGAGAAIRRTRTRLPGGGESPVAVVSVPRERMIGSGIASSLVHEAGHQGASLLDLVNPLKQLIQAVGRGSGEAMLAWRLWERWISEIVADFWSVAIVGVGSTLGLMGVLSLPRGFMFRITEDDPHPTPWVRVRLSCAIGEALYPDPQWRRLAALWSGRGPALPAVPGSSRGERQIRTVRPAACRVGEETTSCARSCRRVKS
jgi:hypothetical protein